MIAAFAQPPAENAGRLGQLGLWCEFRSSFQREFSDFLLTNFFAARPLVFKGESFPIRHCTRRKWIRQGSSFFAAHWTFSF